jgi:outer membrane protein OmpA-like peptidoglycan-associated protein
MNWQTALKKRWANSGDFIRQQDRLQHPAFLPFAVFSIHWIDKVYMGMQIGKNLIKTELPELRFDLNSKALTATHKDTLDQVGHRLAQKIKQEEDVSYYIYPRVAPQEVSDSGDAALLDKKQRQELYALGEKRAHKVQSYLLNNFDITEKNLPVFQPGIIYDKKEPRGTVGFMK